MCILNVGPCDVPFVGKKCAAMLLILSPHQRPPVVELPSKMSSMTCSPESPEVSEPTSDFVL